MVEIGNDKEVVKLVEGQRGIERKKERTGWIGFFIIRYVRVEGETGKSIIIFVRMHE